MFSLEFLVEAPFQSVIPIAEHLVTLKGMITLDRDTVSVMAQYSVENVEEDRLISICAHSLNININLNFKSEYGKYQREQQNHLAEKYVSLNILFVVTIHGKHIYIYFTSQCLNLNNRGFHTLVFL